MPIATSMETAAEAAHADAASGRSLLPGDTLMHRTATTARTKQADDGTSEGQMTGRTLGESSDHHRFNVRLSIMPRSAHSALDDSADSRQDYACFSDPRRVLRECASPPGGHHTRNTI